MHIKLDTLPFDILTQIALYSKNPNVLKLINKKLNTVADVVFKKYNEELAIVDLDLKKIKTEKKDCSPQKLFSLLIKNLCKKIGKAKVTMTWACGNHKNLIRDLKVIDAALKLKYFKNSDSSDNNSDRRFFEIFINFKNSLLMEIFGNNVDSMYMISAAKVLWKEFGFALFGDKNHRERLVILFSSGISNEMKENFVIKFKKNFFNYIFESIRKNTDEFGSLSNSADYASELRKIFEKKGLKPEEIDKKIEYLLPTTATLREIRDELGKGHTETEKDLLLMDHLGIPIVTLADGFDNIKNTMDELFSDKNEYVMTITKEAVIILLRELFP